MVLEKYKEENRNVIILIGILLALSILFYTVYPPLRTAVGIYFFILSFALVIYSNRIFEDYVIGIGKRNFFVGILVGSGVAIGFYILGKIFPGFSFGIPYVPYSVSSNLRWIIICIFAPIAEELATRGALLGFIKWTQSKGGITKFELWSAIVLQALFFMLLHLTAYMAGWYQAPTWLGAIELLSAVQAALIAAFLFGLVFGWIVSLNGIRNLVASIVAHFIINNILFTGSIVYVGQQIYSILLSII